MRYFISDIHGCYEEYSELLEKIHFSEEDELYILGDAVDRGPEPIKVLQDMMRRKNVRFIIGNHDYLMVAMLGKLMIEITEENCESHLTAEDIKELLMWRQDGGEVTARQFAALPREEQWEILDYLKEASVYEVLEDQGRTYLLVHAGLHGFSEEKALEDYELVDFLFERADYEKRYFADENKYLVTGHTPTPKLRTDGKPLIYQKNGHIALDCGCVYGGCLAAYCVETGEAVYVKSKNK